MVETQRMLELAGERFDMPEPAMDRMLRRRERKQRNERIAAAAVGLGVFAAGVVGVVLTLRVTGTTEPASGGGGSGAAAESGLVLPTVAIWAAIVVLTLTAFAAVRLRARFAGADLQREGREPGGVAASARRPAAAPGTTPWKGGTAMDSKSKTGIGTQEAEIAPVRLDDGKVRRTNRWLVGGIVVLAVAVVALGVALIAASGKEGPTTAGATPTVRLNDPSAVALVDGFLAAHNTRDANAVTDQYAENAVYRTQTWDGPMDVSRGHDQIWGAYSSLFGQVPDLRIERTSPVVQAGGVTAYMVRDSLKTNMLWVAVWKDGKIAQQWVLLHP